MELVRHSSLNPEHAGQLVEKLDTLLADYETYTHNIRNIHWNPRLRPHLDLSEKVSRLYYFAGQSKEAIAERIISLGYAPGQMAYEHEMDFSDMDDKPMRINKVREVRNYDGAIYAIIHTSQELLEEVKEVFLLAASYKEKDTIELTGNLAQQLLFTIGIFAATRLASQN